MQAPDYVAVLYGSLARREADKLSDLDVLLISDGFEAGEASRLSRYSWEQFEAMHAYGSLFLHHLKLEGEVLGGSQAGLLRYESMLESLPQYRRGAADLDNFLSAWEDIRDAAEAGDTDDLFELKSLATLTRHSSIVGCFALGELQFSRYGSVDLFVRRRALDPAIGTMIREVYPLTRVGAGASEVDSLRLKERLVSALPLVRELIEEVGRCLQELEAESNAS